MQSRRFSAVLAAAAVTLWAASASGQDFDAQTFTPATAPHGAFATEGSQVLEAWKPAAGALLNYSSRSIVVVEEDINDPDEVVETPVVDQQIAVHAQAALGLFGFLQLGVDIPFYFITEGDLPTAFNESALGDVRFRAQASLFHTGDDDGGFGAGLLLDFTVPTGAEEYFVGSPGVTFGPRLALDGHFGPLWIGGNFGALFREEARFGADGVIGNALVFGLAAEVEILRGMLLATGDIFGRTPAQDFGSTPNTPVEGLLGGKLITTSGVQVTMAAGSGMLAGLGAPEFRMLFGVGYAERDDDFDDDGVDNSADACPEEAEDADGYEDGDGCPELDNDGDAIADGDDECPLSPEDMDGFEDEDGCPDPDNDGDGVYDEDDQCREEAEDADGFEDDDGCPDPDNDGDEVLDATDQCPAEPEDMDGFEDDDGCPEPDNDADEIPDAEDACPNEPGMLEDRGCPPAEVKATRTDSQIEITSKVSFENKSDVLLEESFDVLNQVAFILKRAPEVTKVEVAGHTDTKGSTRSNQELSERRANAVRDYLVGRGIAAERLTAVGYGESQPLEKGSSAEANAKNRRVEFKIVEQGDPNATEAPADESGNTTQDATDDTPTADTPAGESTEAAPKETP